MTARQDRPAISFFKIIVADVDRTFDFYHHVLGVEQNVRVRTGEGHDALDEIVSKPVGDAGAPVLSIKRFLNRAAPPPGELQIGFIVPDVDRALADAVAAGGAVLKPAKDMPEHGVRVAFIHDIEGHAIELVQLL